MLLCLSNTGYSANGKGKNSQPDCKGKGEGEIESMSFGGRFRGISVSKSSWRVRCRGFWGTCFTITAHDGYTEVLMGNGDMYILEPPPVPNPTQGTELDPVEGGLTDTYALEISIEDVTKWNPITLNWDPATECNIWIVVYVVKPKWTFC